MFEKDPVEETLAYKKIEKALEAELEESMKNVPKGMGYCHVYWGRKKRILKEKYSIDWKSPAEMNSRVMFD